MGEKYSTHGHMRNMYKVLVGKPEMNLGIILKIYEEVKCEDMDWTNLTQDRIL
jgi:hypothetical protein